MNYYNEFDPNAAEWLRELIKQGLIPEGIVDERSITDVRADDLTGFRQCHFFAGIGGWSLALQLAGWPADKPVWTGSCPCQPFSSAGKRKGIKDDRDLWPVFFKLIQEAKPEFVFGEQVASSEVVGTSLETDFVDAVRTGDIAKANKLAHKISRSSSLHYHPRWLDRVCADLGSAGYSVRWEVLGAHSVGAPHIRQRLYWGGAFSCSVSDTRLLRSTFSKQQATGNIEHSRVDRLADDQCVRFTQSQHERQSRYKQRVSSGDVQHVGMAYPKSDRNNGIPGIVYPENGGSITGQMRQSAISGNKLCGMDDLQGVGRGIYQSANIGQTPGEINSPANTGVISGGLSVAEHERLQRHAGDVSDGNKSGRVETEPSGSITAFDIPSLSPWTDFDLIYCRDKKTRRVPTESILFGVADGFPEELDGGGTDSLGEYESGFPLTQKTEGRVMLLKGYGNAIVPQVAAAFVGGFQRS